MVDRHVSIKFGVKYLSGENAFYARRTPRHYMYMSMDLLFLFSSCFLYYFFSFFLSFFLSFVLRLYFHDEHYCFSLRHTVMKDFKLHGPLCFLPFVLSFFFSFCLACFLSFFLFSFFLYTSFVYRPY